MSLIPRPSTKRRNEEGKIGTRVEMELRTKVSHFHTEDGTVVGRPLEDVCSIESMHPGKLPAKEAVGRHGRSFFGPGPGSFDSPFDEFHGPRQQWGGGGRPASSNSTGWGSLALPAPAPPSHLVREWSAVDASRGNQYNVPSVAKTSQLDLGLCLGVPPLGEDPPAPLPVLLYCLEMAKPPCPKPTRVLVPKGDKALNSAVFLQFESAAIRDAAYTALLSKTYMGRLVYCFLAKDKKKEEQAAASGPGSASGASASAVVQVADPNAMDVDASQPVVLEVDKTHTRLAERLLMAAQARGIPPPTAEWLKKLQKKPGLTKWSKLQSDFGYVCLPVDGDGHCLFASFEMLAAAKGVKVEVHELRAIAADGYTLNEVVTLRYAYGRGTPEGDYIYQKLRHEGMENDALFLEAFKEGMRTEASFYGNYGEINSLAKYLKINILIVDEELDANSEYVGNWRWQPPTYPNPANHPHTGILRFTKDKKFKEGHYDVYAHDGEVLLDTANLPAVVKALHCIR